MNDESEELPYIREGDVLPMITPGREQKRQNGRRFKEAGQEAFTVTAIDQHGVATQENGKLRVRYITPREAWRLMNFTDEQIDRAFEVTPSKTQRYKQAGNSIVVACLEHIFKGMYIDDTWEQPKQKSLDDWL